MEKLEQQHEGVNMELLKKKRDEIYEDLDKYEKLVEFVNKLKAKYKDYQDYVFYHMLIGSSVSDNHKLSKVDFPGDDSIEKFIDSLQDN